MAISLSFFHSFIHSFFLSTRLELFSQVVKYSSEASETLYRFSAGLMVYSLHFFAVPKAPCWDFFPFSLSYHFVCIVIGKDSQTVREEAARRLRHKQPHPEKERIPEPQVCSPAEELSRISRTDAQWGETHIELLLLLSFSIYEKLIQFCSIDELGTNYPKDMFDPHGWSEDSYYESLGGWRDLVFSKPVVLNCWSLRAHSFSSSGSHHPNLFHINKNASPIAIMSSNKFLKFCNWIVSPPK